MIEKSSLLPLIRDIIYHILLRKHIFLSDAVAADRRCRVTVVDVIKFKAIDDAVVQCGFLRDLVDFTTFAFVKDQDLSRRSSNRV